MLLFNKTLLCFAVALTWVSMNTGGTELTVPDNAFVITKQVLDLITETWDLMDSIDEQDDIGKDNATVAWPIKHLESTALRLYGYIVDKIDAPQKLETDDVTATVLDGVKKLQNTADGILNGIQISDLMMSVRSIENAYKIMEEYIRVGRHSGQTNANQMYSSYTLKKFAEPMLHYSVGSPPKEILKIHTYIVSKQKYNNLQKQGRIFNIIKESMENTIMLCDQKQSVRQLLFNLYTPLLLVQLKGTTLMQFSWLLLHIHKEGSFIFESHTQLKKFKEMMDEQLNALKLSIEASSNDYWRCDPFIHVKDETYLEVAPIMQGFIENEINMNSKQSCLRTCKYYDVAEVKQCSPKEFCARQNKCNGLLLNCEFIDSDMRICQSPHGSNRRYEYIQYKRGTVLGDNSKGCQGVWSKVDSWRKFLVVPCSYCFCLCHTSDGMSDHYFSLRPSLSDISQNKVVTGVRFRKSNRMFHLQVEEGLLGPRGYIHELSRRWVDLPGPGFSYTNESLRDGVDYHTLSWTSRAIDLDNVVAPKNMIVTGVKFRRIGSHLNIEARITPLDFATGELIKPNEKSYWIGNDNTEYSKARRTEIDISNSDLPIKVTTPSKPYISSNKFLKFTYSSKDRDVSQTTLPFIDAQNVAPYPGTPLSGVGIYFKGITGHGGYIGPNVFTYDFIQSIDSR